MNKIFALGYFDSIHIGHRALLREGMRIAQQNNAKLYVVTFNDNFLSVLGRREEEIFLLEERKKILNTIGINDLIVLPTDKDFLSKGKDDFLIYLISQTPSFFICGTDYRFGKNAEGTIQDLVYFSEQNNIEVYIENLLEINGNKVSSSEIRDLLKNGKTDKAENLLGQKFFYSGKVKHGRTDGHKIGFPTLNIDIPSEKIKIKSGVYATETTVENEKYLSVTNVGAHPTFNDNTFNVETHIIGNPGIIYGTDIKVEFYSYIRGIKHFISKEDLAKQIKKDIIYAKEVTK